MKADQVPQDDANYLQGKARDLCYAIDEDGNYTTVLSKGWDAKNIVFTQAWQDINDNIESIRLQVVKGELSPIAFFMEKSLMDLKILSEYMDLPKRKIKKHFEPKVFKNLDNDLLIKYADVFNITPEELKNFQ